MAGFKNRYKKWSEKYNLSYTHQASFKQKWSVSLSPFNILSLLLFYAIIICFLFYLLIQFTPLKKVFFKDISLYELNEQLETNSKALEGMEKELDINKQYSTNLKNILLGENLIDTSVNSQIDTLQSITYVDVKNSHADSVLRSKIENESKIKKKEQPTLQNEFFISPVTGQLSRSINIKENHFGVDIVTLKDEPIKSVLKGQVIFAGWTNKQGNVILIQHKNNIVSVYKHCSVIFKKQGDYIDSGSPIGLVGNTGELTDGPHLHFELWQNGVTLDPQAYFTF